MRDLLKNREVEKRREPEHDVKHERAEKFRQHDLRIPDRCSHKRLDCAELKFLGKKTHRDQRKNQNERKPEEHRIEKCFLHRIRGGPLVHERNLEIKIDPADQQEKYEHDVSDRRMKITAHFASKECVKFSHRLDRHLRLIRVGDLDEYVFEGGATLREFAQCPLPRGREPEDFFTHVETGFDTERKYLPVVVLIGR